MGRRLMGSWIHHKLASNPCTKVPTTAFSTAKDPRNSATPRGRVFQSRNQSWIAIAKLLSNHWPLTVGKIAASDVVFLQFFDT